MDDGNVLSFQIRMVIKVTLKQFIKNYVIPSPHVLACLSWIHLMSPNVLLWFVVSKNDQVAQSETETVLQLHNIFHFTDKRFDTVKPRQKNKLTFRFFELFILFKEERFAV